MCSNPQADCRQKSSIVDWVDFCHIVDRVTNLDSKRGDLANQCRHDHLRVTVKTHGANEEHDATRKCTLESRTCTDVTRA